MFLRLGGDNQRPASPPSSPCHPPPPAHRVNLNFTHATYAEPPSVALHCLADRIIASILIDSTVVRECNVTSTNPRELPVHCRKQIVDFKNVKRREGWNDSFPFGEMALAQGPLLTQLRTPRTSNTGEEGNDSLGISADGEVTLPVIQARDAATPSMIPHPDGLQSAPSEVQEAGGRAASAGEQVEESSQGDVHETAGGVAAAEVQNTVSAQEVEGMEGGLTPDAAEETEGEAAPEEVKEAGAAEDVEEEDVQEEVEETDGYAVSEDVEEEAASQKGSEQGI